MSDEMSEERLLLYGNGEEPDMGVCAWAAGVNDLPAQPADAEISGELFLLGHLAQDGPGAAWRKLPPGPPSEESDMGVNTCAWAAAVDDLYADTEARAGGSGAAGTVRVLLDLLTYAHWSILAGARLRPGQENYPGRSLDG